MAAAKRTKKPTKAEIAVRVRQAGERASSEAEARRAQQSVHQLAEEVGGRKGPEPTRFGDWEKKGIASDF